MSRGVTYALEEDAAEAAGEEEGAERASSVCLLVPPVTGGCADDAATDATRARWPAEESARSANPPSLIEYAPREESAIMLVRLSPLLPVLLASECEWLRSGLALSVALHCWEDARMLLASLSVRVLLLLLRAALSSVMGANAAAEESMRVCCCVVLLCVVVSKRARSRSSVFSRRAWLTRVAVLPPPAVLPAAGCCRFSSLTSLPCRWLPDSRRRSPHAPRSESAAEDEAVASADHARGRHEEKTTHGRDERDTRTRRDEADALTKATTPV